MLDSWLGRWRWKKVGLCGPLQTAMSVWLTDELAARVSPLVLLFADLAASIQLFIIIRPDYARPKVKQAKSIWECIYLTGAGSRKVECGMTGAGRWALDVYKIKSHKTELNR